jgi:hypothetical protein
MYAKSGRVLLVEYKRPGMDLEPLQREEQEKLNEAGVENHVCRSVEDTKRTLRIA